MDDLDQPDDSEAVDVDVRLPLTSTNLPDGFETFVEGTLLQSLTSASKGRTSWCTHWREHPDALHRLFAIWQQWLDVQEQPTQLHDFLRNVLDYHLPLLVGEHGTLRACQYGHKGHEPIQREEKRK